MLTKLNTRLTVIFISLVVIPSVIIAVVFAARSYDNLVANSIKVQDEATQYFTSLMNDSILDRVDELKLVNRAYAFEDLLVEQQEDLLRNLLQDRRAYEQITVLNPDASERFHVARYNALIGSDLSNIYLDEVFQAVMETKDVQYSKMNYDSVTGEPFLTIGVPYIDVRSTAIRSVVIAEFRFRLIGDLLAEIQQRPAYNNLTIFMIDDAGSIVAHRDPSVVLNHLQYRAPAENGQAQGLDAEPAIVVSQPLSFGDIQFAVVSQERVSDALQPVNNILMEVGLVTLVAVAIAVILVALVVRQVVAPIEELSRAAQAIQTGDFSARSQIKGFDEIGTLARTFNSMAKQLQNLFGTLEERVHQRVRDINVASEVSRQLTTQLDQDALLTKVTDLTAEAFNFYHVSIFLFDKQRQTLALRQGVGIAGQRMMEAGKIFRLDEPGVVPQAARKAEVVLANDVRQSKDHVPNPLLTSTRSELAIPILYQGELLGVLDLQDERLNRFQTHDVNLMTTLAEQIAVAIHNAQSFEEIQAAQQAAERSDKIKSAFLASMSHELRTPLNAIINFTRYVVKGSLGPVTQQQAETLSEVVDSAKHLLNLINDVLDMSKIEADSLTLFVEDDVDVRSILNSALSTGKVLLSDKPVEIETEIADYLPPIRADRQRIVQVMLNIMSNACKFTEEGVITLTAYPADDELIVSVRDTGPGIASEDLYAVFEAFKQTATGLRQGGGTGLGMPITKSLVEAHGGRVWLDSEVGVGTTFYIAIPIKSEALVDSLVA
jgi:signal transduction histidine kinase